jgi:hypothetical protein
MTRYTTISRLWRIRSVRVYASVELMMSLNRVHLVTINQQNIFLVSILEIPSYKHLPTMILMNTCCKILASKIITQLKTFIKPLIALEKTLLKIYLLNLATMKLIQSKKIG